MAEEKFLEVKTRSGDWINVDISDEACLKFGFKHGDKIITPRKIKATVIGVAFGTGGGGCCGRDCSKEYVLWFSLDCSPQKAVYWDCETDLKAAGFCLQKNYPVK